MLSEVSFFTPTTACKTSRASSVGPGQVESWPNEKRVLTAVSKVALRPEFSHVQLYSKTMNLYRQPLTQHLVPPHQTRYPYQHHVW